MSSPLWSGSDPWFRVGRLEVTTTVGVVILATVGTIVGAFTRLASWTMFTAPQVLSGELWRIVTWPWVDGLSLWTFLSFLVFWYFGSMIERELGRSRMLRFLVEIWTMATAVHLLVGLALPGATILLGLGTFQFILLLLFIAEAPNRPFLFGIPAWILGAALVALQMLQLLAMGAWGGLIAELITLAGAAVVGRRHGLLTDLDWIPGRPRTHRRQRRRTPRRRPQPRSGREALSVPGSAVSSAEQRMDELLDKINHSGMDSLTRKERSELTRLAQQRRR